MLLISCFRTTVATINRICHSLGLKPQRLQKSSQGMVRSLTQQQKDEVKEHEGCQKDRVQGSLIWGFRP